MYANYLIEVGKLVFIVGDNQNTAQFKTFFQAGSTNKQKIFYKCIQQVPNDTFVKDKQEPGQKKGIIRKDWFNKLLNKNPEMIVMIVNWTHELQGNQVWQDRLKIIIKKINKVYDLMRSNDKQQIRLKIVILISKHSFDGVNLHEKITNFLKTYQKSLYIIQYEYYAKEISKIRNQWVYELQKNYQNKYKKIQKRAEESFSQRKIGCMIKIAILSQMIIKKDPKQKYIDTYKILRGRFSELIKSVTIISHYQIREVRSVADVVFLRYIKILISLNVAADKIFKITLDHMAFYKLPNLSINQTHKYYYYEQLLWRCVFIQNFMEILYSNDLIQTLSPISLSELLNQLITYLHALSLVSEQLVFQQKNLGAQQIQQKQQNFIGLISYKTQQLVQTDIIYSFILNILSHKKDYLTKGIQLISRYKTMNIFKKNQLLFLNVYLLRLYFNDNKIQGFITIYDEVMKEQLSKSNYFLLNEIFNEIKQDFSNITEEQKVMFYGASCLICDYFQNIHQLSNHLQNLFRSILSQSLTLQKSIKKKSIDLLQVNQPTKQAQSNQLQMNEIYKFSLKKKSSIGSIQCYIDEQFVFIQNQIKIKLSIALHPVLLKNGCEIQIIFNHKQIKRKVIVPSGQENMIEHVLSIKPLDYFTKDENLRIQCIKIHPIQNLQFQIPNRHISFLKHRQIKVYTNIRCPQIQINSPYSTFFINQVSKFQINIQKLQGFNIDAKCQIRQQDAYGKTEVFVDFDQRINLTNSNYYQELLGKDKEMSQFWLKCNKIGDKKLKFVLQITVQRMISNNSTDLLQETQIQNSKNKHILKQTFNITKQLKFKIQTLFNIKKTFNQFSNQNNRNILNGSIPVDKNIIVILEIQSVQDVFIKEIAQHKNPKKIQYFKEINKKNFILKKGMKIKLNLIFKVPLEYQDQIQLYLMAVYIKWTRIQSKLLSQPFENLFLDEQTKINCNLNPISLTLNIAEHFVISKNQPSQLSISIKNHSPNKSHIYIQVQGTSAILRIGQRAKQLFLEGQSETTREFMIFPISSGYLTIPNIKIYVDGIQRKMSIGSGQLIKCI